MKKLLLAISALILTFTVVACSSKNESVEGNVNFTGITDNNLETDYTYNDDYFLDDSTTANKYLADTSIALALTGCNAPGDNPTAYMEKYFDTCNFKNFYACDDYKKPTSENTMGYGIASKEINLKTGKYLLVAVGVRGFSYGLEWASNFDLGKTGNHHGFDQASDKLITDINSYVEKYNKNNLKLKVWLTGYSRAGAVAGLAASKLVDQNKIDAKDIYGITFEAPASRVNDKKYDNIYNYVNGNDLVTKLIPASMNLVRPGSDIDYTLGKDYTKMVEYVAGLTKNVTLKEYSGEKPMSELITSMIEALFGKDGSFRATYVDEYQNSLQYVIKFLFGLNTEEVNKLKDYFSNHSLSAGAALISKNNEKLKKFITDALDATKITYNSTDMNNALDKLMSLVIDRFMNNIEGTDLAAIILNINSIIQNHYCEVSLAYMRQK